MEYTLNGGESGVTMAEAAWLMRRPMPTTERDLDRFAYDAPAYGVRTNCDGERFWLEAKQRERVRRLKVAHRIDGDATMPAAYPFAGLTKDEITFTFEGE
jgi:hypothetical protein